jgi:hypothetical protein
MLAGVADPIPMIGDVRDLCSEAGYQWEFRCKRCGNGYRSPFQQNITGHGRGLMRAASTWFGGKVATAYYTMDSYNAGAGRSGDGSHKSRHYVRAVEAMLPSFRQCRGCSRWTCVELCWNEAAGQCLECAPPAATTPEGATKGQCPSCAAYGTGKFCEKCGTALVHELKCAGCGSKAARGAAFCADCGKPLGAAAK